MKVSLKSSVQNGVGLLHMPGGNIWWIDKMECIMDHNIFTRVFAIL